MAKENITENSEAAYLVEKSSQTVELITGIRFYRGRLCLTLSTEEGETGFWFLPEDWGEKFTVVCLSEITSKEKINSLFDDSNHQS